ncbi:hypothetical protein HK105_200992 [Polyrhizophydium stewartii]|uniref:Ankyrin repeat domain-containing protein n=1 Tax=Polyrhizophydium stewartii TaxID=2732419 RepID=A0ABR4MZI7_9FUNG
MGGHASRQAPPTAHVAAGAGAGAALPWGRSHWDRLPRELRDMVLAHTGLPGRFARADVLAVELKGLTARQRELVWAAVLDDDAWAGDLAVLPKVSVRSDCFLHIRSRAMFGRLAAVELVHPLVLQRVAVRHRWTDLFDHRNQRDLATAAACEGAVWALEDIASRRAGPGLSLWLVDFAARGGHLGAVQWLDSRLPGRSWAPDVAERAAESGCLELVAWIDEHHPETRSPMAIVGAARAGHLAVVAWLRERGGHRLADAAARAAAAAGHLAIVQHLHEHGLVKEPQPLLESIIDGGNMACADWVRATFETKIDQAMLMAACKRNHAAAALWLLAQPGIKLNQHAIARAVMSDAVDVLKGFLRHSPSRCRMLAAKAVEHDNAGVLEWLYVRHPSAIPQTPEQLMVLAERLESRAVRRILAEYTTPAPQAAPGA